MPEVIMKLLKKKDAIDKMNSNKEYGEYTSILNEGLVYKNSRITGCGHLKISCLVECDIEVEGDVYVGFTGVVKGNINCTNLVAEGVITGETINATQNVSIIKGGSVEANLICAGLYITDNSVFNGACNMSVNKELSVDKEPRVATIAAH